MKDESERMNFPSFPRSSVGPAALVPTEDRGNEVDPSSGFILHPSSFILPSVLGLDIGGANLKAAHSSGVARSSFFPLWKDAAGLPAALQSLVQTMPPFDLIAVTMTGELCDCFETKRQGVNVILDAVEGLAGGKVRQVSNVPPLPIWVWQCAREEATGRLGRFVDVPSARSSPLQTAAANWLAVAAFCGRYAPRGPALLIDIGSTTTDIVPLLDGQPVPNGLNDPERLRYGELVYTGIRRTPLVALLSNVAAELFATTLDVYLVRGDIPEDTLDCATADGRPATVAAAHDRLSRMLCADRETCTEQEREQLALRAADRQAYMIGVSLEHVASRLPAPPEQFILAGSGEFLARVALRRSVVVGWWGGAHKQPAHWPEALARDDASLANASGQCTTSPPHHLTTSPPEHSPGVISLSEQLGPAASEAACAYALAVLAQERVGRA